MLPLICWRHTQGWVLLLVHCTSTPKVKMMVATNGSEVNNLKSLPKSQQNVCNYIFVLLWSSHECTSWKSCYILTEVVVVRFFFSSLLCLFPPAFFFFGWERESGQNENKCSFVLIPVLDILIMDANLPVVVSAILNDIECFQEEILQWNWVSIGPECSGFSQICLCSYAYVLLIRMHCMYPHCIG